MSASYSHAHVRLHGRGKGLVRPALLVLLAALLVLPAAAFGIWPAKARAAEVNPFVMALDLKRDGKPDQKIIAFKVAPDAAARLLAGDAFVAPEALARIKEATLAHDAATINRLAAEEGWAWFALSAGWIGSAGTFAEHALGFTGLDKANNALTNIGGVLSIIQVSIDLTKGDTRLASVDALKGLTSFGISKFGSGVLQIGGIAFFVVDLTLTSFGNAAWSAREDAWRQVYQKYYREQNAGAETAPAASSDASGLTARFRAVRARAEGGRSLNDWKIVAAFYFKNAKTPKKFEEYLNADVDTYVAKFWTSPNFLENASDGDWATAGIARGASLTDAIKAKLQAEHADAIRSMLVKKVFPDIQRKAIEAALQAEADELNRDVVVALNDTITIEMSAYDLTGPTKFEIVRPKGGVWSGTIASGEPRKLKITKLAYMLAGFPDTIRLLGPDGPEEKNFELVNDAATVVFGAPETPTVTVMSRSETGLACTVTSTTAAGVATTTHETRPAPPTTPVHMGVKADGTMVLGQFSAGSGWQIASPGKYSDAGMTFGAPYFENIDSLSGCALARKDHDFYGAFANESCTVKRILSEKGADGTTRELACTSSMTLSLIGAFSPVNGAMTYMPLDAKIFGQMQKGYEDAITQMQNMPGGAGMQITDPSKLVPGQ